MTALTNTGVCVILLSFCAFAGIKEDTKSIRHSFTAGLALPLSNTSAMTIPESNYKELKPGWEGSWTFLGMPFTNSETILSGLGFGGKISYSRWERDSTFTPVTFLGVQGIIRHYLPLKFEHLHAFSQVGAGIFIGEYSFSDPDTVDWTKPDFTPVVTRGKVCTGLHIGAGVDLSVVELLPVLTMVFTRNDISVWLSLNLGMTF